MAEETRFFEDAIKFIEKGEPPKRVRNVIEVIGSQWGDEGKGKVANLLEADLCIRATGGNNAGHTVIKNGKKYALHLLPSSIINEGTVSMLAPGVYIDPAVLIDEIEKMRETDVCITPDNLVISARAHMILPYHRGLDIFYESLRENKIGTTKRGIGPCAEDKMRRTGIQIGMLLWDDEKLKARIKMALEVCNMMFSYVNSQNISEEDRRICRTYNVEEIFELCKYYRGYLGKFIKDATPVVNEYLGKEDKTIVIEGAQAHSLDIDHGDYDDVTSSNPNASGSCSGAGIGPTFVKEVIGIAKAYCSRVGEGPFDTELIKEEHKVIRKSPISDETLNNIGRDIRELGHEYGTTTGRPRRCGLLDLVHLKEAAQVNGFSSWCVNHIDTIGKIGEKYGFIDVCIGYSYKGDNIDYVPTIDRENCVPILKTFDGGWDATCCRTYEDLPENAKDYINYIEQYTGVFVKYIGTGPSNEDIIIRN